VLSGAMNAGQVLALLADSPVVMGVLDSGPCTLEHVSVRDPAGPDARVDSCPCGRVLASGEQPTELGGGQYVSSPRHTLGDLVRDVILGSVDVQE
jgi:hypothetical protein